MTGYGASSFQLDNTAITVEIKSVNHRFLDIIPKYPRAFLFLEDRIKQIIKHYFNRGRIEIHIDIEGETFVNKSIVTDWSLMDQFIQQIHIAKERYQLEGDIPVSIITQLPELITVTEKEEKPNELQEQLLDCIKLACEQMLKMRLEEGKNLIHDIMNRVQVIRDMVHLLEERRETVVSEYRTRIQSRIEDYLEDATVLEESRLHQEIALLAEKGDISEEITRLLSHVDHVEEICKSNQPIGRKLDFVLQEMNREANTIGSKSTDHKIGVWTVTMKSEIEKIKEQVQNIE
jgi:uncharacterized protein (TIGR00255 family)